MAENEEKQAKKKFKYLVFDPASREFQMFDELQEAQDYGKMVWWEKFDVLQIEVIQRFHFQKVFNNERGNGK